MAVSTNPGNGTPTDGLKGSVTSAVVDTTQGLHALGPEWQALAARSTGHHWFHTYTWCGAVWQHVGQPAGQRLRVITVRQDGRLVLVWPLVVDGRVLRMLNSGTLEYRDLLVESTADAADAGDRRKAWLDAAWREFTGLRGPSLFVFQNLREPSHLAGLLQDRLKLEPHTGDWAFVTRLHRYSGWQDFETRLPKALVSDQRRQWRRARQQHPGIEVRTVADPDEIDATLTWLLQHKIRWLDANELPGSKFRSPDFEQLLKAAAKAAALEGTLGMFKLSSPQHVLSAGIGMRKDDEFVIHMFAYDSAHGNLSPSRLLLEGMLRWCFDHGIRNFDFMPGFAPYKKIWADDVVATRSYVGARDWQGRWQLRVQQGYLRHAAAWRRSPLHGLLSSVWRRLPLRARQAVTARLASAGFTTLAPMDRTRPAPEVASHAGHRPAP